MMKPMNAVAWRLKSIPTGYYEDKWLTWNTDWKQHDDAVLGKCGIEYAVPMPVPPSRSEPPANSSSVPVRIGFENQSRDTVPTFEQWYSGVSGGQSFDAVFFQNTTSMQNYVLSLTDALQQYVTFTAQWLQKRAA